MRHEAAAGGTARYDLLETLRDYAREQFAADAEREAVEHRYAAYYLALTESAAAGLEGPEPAVWLDRLEWEQPNVRAAFHWAQARGEAELCLRMAAAQHWFWLRRGQLREGVELLDIALSLPDPVRPSVRATALLAAADLATDGGIVSRALTYRQEALALAHAGDDRQGIARAWLVLDRAAEALALFEQLGDTRGVAQALWALGDEVWRGGDVALANSRYARALTLFRQLGDTARTAALLADMGGVARDQEAYARANELFAESLALKQQAGETQALAWHLHGSGELELLRGNYAEAQHQLEQSVELGRRQGNERLLAFALYNLGFVAQHLGDTERMAACFRESLQRTWQRQRRYFCGAGIAGMAAVAGTQGQLERAARLFGAADGIPDEYQSFRVLAHRREIERNMAAVRAQVDAQTWQACWAEGQALTLEEALAYALEPDPMPPEAPGRRATAGAADPAATLGPAAGGAGSVSLTGREVEILRLVTEGLSYQAIGERLGISRHTVNAHLRRIYGKLGVTSRSAATRRAVVEQLV